MSQSSVVFYPGDNVVFKVTEDSKDVFGVIDGYNQESREYVVSYITGKYCRKGEDLRLASYDASPRTKRAAQHLHWALKQGMRKPDLINAVQEALTMLDPTEVIRKEAPRG